MSDDDLSAGTVREPDPVQSGQQATLACARALARMVESVSHACDEEDEPPFVARVAQQTGPSHGEPMSKAPERNKVGGTGLSKQEGSERLRQAKEELPHGDSGGLHNPKNIDYKQLAGSNRALHKQLGAGKGDDLRPAQVPDEQVTQNWCHTFGHRYKAGWPLCLNGCGTRKGKA